MQWIEIIIIIIIMKLVIIIIGNKLNSFNDNNGIYWYLCSGRNNSTAIGANSNGFDNNNNNNINSNKNNANIIKVYDILNYLK